MFAGGWRWFADPGEDGVSNSELIIKVPPGTPPGDYKLYLEVTRFFDVTLNLPEIHSRPPRTVVVDRVNLLFSVRSS